jgi:hypothetical protein
MQSAMCNVRNIKCNVQTGVLAVQGLSASVGFGVAGFDEKQCRRAMELAEEASASANVLDVEWRGSPLDFA